MKLKRFILNIDDILAGTIVCLIVFITILGVFMRYVMNAPLKWTEEVSLGLFVWFIMLGASSAVKRKANISIDFLVDIFPLKVQRIINICITVISIIVLSILAILGYILAMKAGMKLTALLKVPYTYIDLAIPVSCILMIMHLIARLKEQIINKEI